MALNHNRDWLIVSKLCNCWTNRNMKTMSIKFRWKLGWKFKIFRKKSIPYKNILKLVDFKFVLPASNAVAERVFSISIFILYSNIWCSQKFQMGVEILKSLLIIKCNFEMDCSEFKTYLSNRPFFLMKVMVTVRMSDIQFH